MRKSRTRSWETRMKRARIEVGGHKEKDETHTDEVKQSPRTILDLTQASY